VRKGQLKTVGNIAHSGLTDRDKVRDRKILL